MHCRSMHEHGKGGMLRREVLQVGFLGAFEGGVALGADVCEFLGVQKGRGAGD